MDSTKIINVSKSDTFEEILDLFKNADAKEVIFILPKTSKLGKKLANFEILKTESHASGKKVSIMSKDPAVARLVSEAGLELMPGSGKATPKKRSSSTTKKRTSKSRALEAPDDLPIVADVVSEKSEEQNVAAADTEPVEQVGQQTEEQPEQQSEQETQLPQPKVEEQRVENIQPVSLDDNFTNEPATLTSTPSGDLLADLANAKNHEKMMKDILDIKNEQSVKIEETREKMLNIDVKKKFKEQDDSEQLEKIWSNQSPTPRRESPRGKMLIWLGAGVVVAAGMFMYSTMGKADVIIQPQTQDVNFQIKVTASTGESGLNPSLNRIPGQAVNSQKEDTGTFNLTQTKDIVQKASGIITIFNTSGSAQRLVATTRFESDKGLIFRIPETITVPSGTTTNPGSIQSVVYADRPGNDYNIPVGKFTIPGFKDTPKYTSFYATSSQPMTGGLIGPSKIVTEDDYTNAQENLSGQVRGEILDDLKSKVDGLKILDSVDIKINTPETNAKVGDGAPNLQMKVSGSASTIAFNEDDIKSLVKNYLSKNGDYYLVDKGSKITYQNASLENDGKDLSFVVLVQGTAAINIDKQKLVGEISGMSSEAVKNYFQSLKDKIQSAHVKLSPPWVQKVPKNPQKINIDIEI